MVILKARQLGFSTLTQAMLIHECTLRERVEAVVVAQDGKTGDKLYQIGERIYTNLPDDPFLKPKLGRHRRSKYLHFAGDGLWQMGQVYPDSHYTVDTAGEYQAGRGTTPTRMHLSELAFWPQIGQKLDGLMQAIPDTPDTLVVYESTANGFNEFKDIWDDAEAGHSDFIPFFWPWWKDEEYSLDFASETEREHFKVGDEGNPFAEREPDLVEHHGLSLEQLNWRRWTIANKCRGDLRIFDQEYPTIPEDAFIATGQKVFDPYRVQQLIRRVEQVDPKTTSPDNPGPQIGDFKPAEMRTQINRSGDSIQIPGSALWVPRQPGMHNPSAPFRLWLPSEEKPQGDYVIGVDVSGGNTETTREVDYHAIEVIDHKTLEQVAEYRTRNMVAEDLAKLLLMTALHFNDAWIAIERTGGFGSPLLRILYLDYRYMFIYRPKKFGNAAERTENRLGWDTNQRTKPELVEGMAGLIQNEVDGVKSRFLAEEISTYTRTEKGTMEAEPGKFDDLLMAYMIAQQVARELPMKKAVTASAAGQSFRAAGVGAYDSRY